MALTGLDEDQFDEQGSGGAIPPPQQSGPSNRPFLLAIGIIGAILVLALIGMLVILPGILNNNRAQSLAQAAQVNAQNTATSAAATQVAFTNLLALTPSATTQPTATIAPTNTPVVAVATDTPTPAPTHTEPAVQATQAVDMAGRTATVAALLTQIASGGTGTPQITGTVGATSTALPTTGFADEVGLPGLALLAAAFVVVIVVARRLRLSKR